MLLVFQKAYIYVYVQVQWNLLMCEVRKEKKRRVLKHIIIRKAAESLIKVHISQLDKNQKDLERLNDMT